MTKYFGICAAAVTAACTASPLPPEPPKPVYDKPEFLPKKPMPNQVDGISDGKKIHCAALANKGGGFTFLVTVNDSSGEWRIVETSTSTFFTRKQPAEKTLTTGALPKSEASWVYDNNQPAEPEFALAAELLVHKFTNVCKGWQYRFMNNDNTLRNVEVKPAVSPAQYEGDKALIESVSEDLQIFLPRGMNYQSHILYDLIS